MRGPAERAREAFFSRKDFGDREFNRCPVEGDFWPINYRPLKGLGTTGAIAEHEFGQNKCGDTAQLEAVDKLLDPKTMVFSDTACVGTELSKDAKHGENFGASKLAKALAVYDLSDPGAA